MTDNIAVLRRIAASAADLTRTLVEAEDIQWQPSLTPKPREDTTERSKGGISDPTSAIVADDRRLAVRAAVISAEQALGDTERALVIARADLERAIDRWAGH